MPAPRIDGTITFGNILSLLGFLFAAFMAYSAMSAELQVQRVQLNAVQSQMQEMAHMMAREAGRDVSIREIQRRVDNLERKLP